MNMVKSGILAAAIAGVSLILSGCAKGAFDEGGAKMVVEAQPISLNGEQVTLTGSQVDCGVEANLWDAPSQVAETRSSARLEQKGRDLNFSDDVSIGEPDYRQPYTQVRGTFQVQLDDPSNLRDGEEKGTKLVDGKLAVKVAHSCFAGPLPVMGVKHGKFQQGAPATLQFHQEGEDWQFDKVVH